VIAKQQKRISDWKKFCLESGMPPWPYDRVKLYGNTPTPADRSALGAGTGQVVDHDPPLVVRYYLGDSAHGEKAGYLMTQSERLISAQDRTRMRLHSKSESDQQAEEMKQFSIGMMNKYDPYWSMFDKNWRSKAYCGI
jgi:hypothetical protein